MYPYNRVKCEKCGKFVATQNIGNDKYWCIDCIAKQMAKESMEILKEGLKDES